MSFDISGVGASPTADIQPALASGKTAPAATTKTTEEAAVEVDLSPASTEIPASVTEAIASASDAYEKLAAAGNHLHFGTDESGQLQIELQDADGTAIGKLDPSDALRVAAGENLI